MPYYPPPMMGDILSAPVRGTSRFERWYTVGHNTATSHAAAVTIATGTLVAAPFAFGALPVAGVVDRLAVYVGTGAASAVARFGIYAATSISDSYPGELVVDSGEFTASSSNQARVATVTANLRPGVLYWGAYICGTAAPAIRGQTAQGGALPFYGVDSGLTSLLGQTLTVARAYGALPTTFPSGASVTQSLTANVYVRFAS